MIENIMFFSAGLLIGWNVLPQPAWIKAIYDTVVAKLQSMVASKDK